MCLNSRVERFAVFAPVLQTQLDPSKEPAARVDEIFTRFAAVVASSPRETEHYVGIAIVEKIIGDGRGRDT